ncbi:MAG: hypothetical protein AAFN78_08785 [Pseudomonadota bacterium]
MRKMLATALLCLSPYAHGLEVPVGDLDAWTALTFNGIPANSVSATDGALHIAVDSSASPLVHQLPAPTQVSGITVVASWNGALQIADGAVQGDENTDDFVLKLGIVESGDRTLGWVQRRIAAKWVRQLFSLAPRGTGIERINFLSTTQSPTQLGSSRVHPLSELLHEERIVHLDAPGVFEMTHQFDMPVEVLGLWISSDGDNTGSAFDLRIDRIHLHTE